MKSGTKGFLAGVILTAAAITGYRLMPGETPSNKTRTETPSSLVEKIEDPYSPAVTQKSSPIDGKWKEILGTNEDKILLTISDGRMIDYRGEKVDIKMTKRKDGPSYNYLGTNKGEIEDKMRVKHITFINSNLIMLKEHVLKRIGTKEEPTDLHERIYQGKWKLIGLYIPGEERPTKLEDLPPLIIHGGIVEVGGRVPSGKNATILKSTKIKDVYLLRIIDRVRDKNTFYTTPIKVIDSNNLILYRRGGILKLKRE